MEIIIADYSGFCFGVKNAVEKTEETLKSNINTIATGDLIHNPQEVNRLKGLGFKIENNPTLTHKEANIIIRSHGETLENIEKYKELGYNVIDCTCPVLLSIYKRIQKYEEEGYKIVIIGKKEHPEIIAMAGHLKKEPIIINSADEAKKVDGLDKLYIISQTTNIYEKFFELSDIIEDSNTNVVIKNTICNATKNRQRATIELAKTVDAMVVIGGRTSSNTNKLFELSKTGCIHTCLDNWGGCSSNG